MPIQTYVMMATVKTKQPIASYALTCAQRKHASHQVRTAATPKGFLSTHGAGSILARGGAIFWILPAAPAKWHLPLQHYLTYTWLRRLECWNGSRSKGRLLSYTSFGLGKEKSWQPE